MEIILFAVFYFDHHPLEDTNWIFVSGKGGEIVKCQLKESQSWGDWEEGHYLLNKVSGIFGGSQLNEMRSQVLNNERYFFWSWDEGNKWLQCVGALGA